MTLHNTAHFCKRTSVSMLSLCPKSNEPQSYSHFLGVFFCAFLLSHANMLMSPQYVRREARHGAVRWERAEGAEGGRRCQRHFCLRGQEPHRDRQGPGHGHGQRSVEGHKRAHMHPQHM